MDMMLAVSCEAAAVVVEGPMGQRRTRRTTERKRRQTALSVCRSEKAGRCVKRNM